MQNIQVFQVPDELSLLDFFEIEPLDSIPKDGYWCYEIIDELDTKLRISFNTHEESLQTILYRGEQTLITVVNEGAIRLSIIDINKDKILEGEFRYANAHTKVVIQIKPVITVQWSTLIDEK